MNKPLKPFDLAAAQRGEPICTRDGRRAQLIGTAPEWAFTTHPVVAWVEHRSDVDEFTETGAYVTDEQESDADLFMLPRQHTVWLNVWRDKRDDYHAAVYREHQHALDLTNRLCEHGHTILVSARSIEWEE